MTQTNTPSMLRIPLRKGLQRSQSLSERLIFPKGGDSSIFWGVGRKYFGGIEDQLAFKRQPGFKSESSVRRSVSVKNIMNVADIEGASPSVASEKIKNIQRGKSNLQNSNYKNSWDVLGQYEKIFALKKITSDSCISGSESLNQGSLSYSLKEMSPPRRYNPTFITTMSLHH